MTEEQINNLFWVCVDLLDYVCSLTGLSYEFINILLFVIIQPLLIIMFYTLWKIERWRRRSC